VIDNGSKNPVQQVMLAGPLADGWVRAPRA